MEYRLIDDPLCDLDDTIQCYVDCKGCPYFYDCMESPYFYERMEKDEEE